MRKGWALGHSSEESILFRDNCDAALAVPLHPTRPDLIYLEDLLSRTPVLHQEFIAEAFDELPAEDLRLDVVIAPGQADDEDIRALLDALSALNCALGGAGLAAEQIETVTA